MVGLNGFTRNGGHQRSSEDGKPLPFLGLMEKKGGNSAPETQRVVKPWKTPSPAVTSYQPVRRQPARKPGEYSVQWSASWGTEQGKGGWRRKPGCKT